jgi:uncharacterized protein (DUF2164 family)
MAFSPGQRPCPARDGSPRRASAYSLCGFVRLHLLPHLSDGPMAITLADHARKQALTSIKRFRADNLEGDVTDLRTIAVLEFVLKEIGSTVYNAGVADAQAYLRDRVADLEGTCFEPAFAYWPKSPTVRRKRPPLWSTKHGRAPRSNSGPWPSSTTVSTDALAHGSVQLRRRSVA